jgi:hypothetical protein
MSGLILFNPSLLEVVISSPNTHVLIRDWRNLSLLIIFNAWWVSLTVGSWHPIASSNHTQAPCGPLYLHCRMETGGIISIIGIVCHQVLHLVSPPVISSMWNHLIGKVLIATFNESKESDVHDLTCSTVDELAFTTLTTQKSQGITIVSWRRKFVLDISILSILTEFTVKTL